MPRCQTDADAPLHTGPHPPRLAPLRLSSPQLFAPMRPTEAKPKPHSETADVPSHSPHSGNATIICRNADGPPTTERVATCHMIVLRLDRIWDRRLAAADDLGLPFCHSEPSGGSLLHPRTTRGKRWFSSLSVSRSRYNPRMKFPLLATLLLLTAAAPSQNASTATPAQRLQRDHPNVKWNLDSRTSVDIDCDSRADTFYWGIEDNVVHTFFIGGKNERHAYSEVVFGFERAAADKTQSQNIPFIKNTGYYGF